MKKNLTIQDCIDLMSILIARECEANRYKSLLNDPRTKLLRKIRVDLLKLINLE